MIQAMGRPIKLSDRLAEAAAEASRIADRSIPAQIEHWANLGRAVERSLTGHAVELIKAAEGDPSALTTEEGRKANLLEGLRHASSPEGRHVALATISGGGRVMAPTRTIRRCLYASPRMGGACAVG